MKLTAETLKKALRDSAAYTRRAFALVWRSSRALTIALALLTLLVAAVPPGIAWAGKRIVDALVDRVIFASNREDQVAATRALDRVLLWNFYVVPQFSRPNVWLAYWNKFGIPDKQPTYVGPDLDSWWIDVDKEKALAAKYKGLN